MNAVLEQTPPAPAATTLPSGRSVLLKVGDNEELLEIRSPQGEVEVRIVLTDSGPVVKLSAARLDLEAADTIQLGCRRLEIHTSEETRLHSDGPTQISGESMRVRTEGDIRLNGGIVYLNCDENETP